MKLAKPGPLRPDSFYLTRKCIGVEAFYCAENKRRY
jgi:hypothetical protein